MSEWTEERVEAFRQLHSSNTMSFSQIADRLCRDYGMTVTRHACIGKANRMGMSNPRPPRKPKPVRVAKRGKTSFTPPQRSFAPLPPQPQRLIPIPTRAHACTLLDLCNTNCRWPIWADDAPAAERFYCGVPSADMAEGVSYCAYHSRVAHRPRLAISEADRQRRRRQGKETLSAFWGGPKIMQAAE